MIYVCMILDNEIVFEVLLYIYVCWRLQNRLVYGMFLWFLMIDKIEY